MWPWFWALDESQQSVIIGISGFIAAFLVIQLYFIKKRKRYENMKNGSSNYDLEFTESLLSKYSAKFTALTKMIQNLSLRLEFVEKEMILKYKNQANSLKPKPKVKTLGSVNSVDNLLIYDSDVTKRSEAGDISDIHLQGDITESVDNSLGIETPSHNLDDVSNMTIFILELLNTRPMSSTEIQQEVKKSREHTSRFMKGLFIKQLVSREMHTKPFIYRITDEGRRLLKSSRNSV